MNYFSKRGPKAHRVRRSVSFSPSLEALETRAQPGSVLPTSPDAALPDIGADRQQRALRRSKGTEDHPRKRVKHDDGEASERRIKAKEKAKQQEIVTPPPSATKPPPQTTPPPPTIVPRPARELPPALGIAGSPNSNQAHAPTPSPAMESVGTAHPVSTRFDRTVANPQIRSLAPQDSLRYGPDAMTSWSSFLGSAHLDILRPITVGPDGLYTGGFITDPANPGVADMLIAKVSVDGTTLLNAVALNFPGGTFAELKGIDVDSEGNVYAIGISNFQGFLSRVYFRLDADWQTISWTIASSVPGEGNDIFHDERTYTIYVTGTTDARSIGFPEKSLQVSWFSDLANPAGPTSIFGYVYTYSGFDGAEGNAIGVGSDSTLQVAGTFLKGADTYAAQHEISADGETASGIYFETPGYGALIDIQVDRNGTAFGVGYIPTSVGDGRRELLLTKINPGLSVEYAYSFGADDVELHGWGITLGNTGQIYVSGSIGVDGDFDALVARFSSDGTMMTDAVVTGGSSDELALSIDYDPVTDAVYTVGYTISGEFETTSGSFQPGFGGLMDGFIMRLSDFV